MSGLKMKYFVLKPRSKTKDDPYAYASRCAIKEYADRIAAVNMNLAQDMWNWWHDEERRNDELSPLEDI